MSFLSRLLGNIQNGSRVVQQLPAKAKGVVNEIGDLTGIPVPRLGVGAWASSTTRATGDPIAIRRHDLANQPNFNHIDRPQVLPPSVGIRQDGGSLNTLANIIRQGQFRATPIEGLPQRGLSKITTQAQTLPYAPLNVGQVRPIRWEDDY